MEELLDVVFEDWDLCISARYLFSVDFWGSGEYAR